MDLWQRFADGWHDALLAFDRDLRVVAVNAPAAALFGAAPDALVGGRLSAVAPAAGAVLEPLVVRGFDELNVFAQGLRPFGGDETFSAMTHRLAGDDTLAFNLHRERDGNWPTDSGWAHRELAFANRLLQAYTNNTPYGLSAGVWTDKGAKSMYVAQRLQAGVVWCSTFNQFDPSSPFGGYRESGFGREGGVAGLRAYLSV